MGDFFFRLKFHQNEYLVTEHKVLNHKKLENSACAELRTCDLLDDDRENIFRGFTKDWLDEVTESTASVQRLSYIKTTVD